MHKLPDLLYDYGALEPHIDAETMEIHHSKHHQGYVDKLNVALEGNEDLENHTLEQLLQDLDEVPEELRTSVRNNGGGHYNHSLFWRIMSPAGGGIPEGALHEALARDLGGFEEFKNKFTEAATTRFGSGWAWLTVGNSPDRMGELKIESSANQDNPIITKTGTPILGLDVWEHAYYLKYKNKRPDYIKAWWNVVDWKQVAENYQNALS